MIDVHKMLSCLVFMLLGGFFGGILIAAVFIDVRFIAFEFFPALFLLLLVAGGIWEKN